MASKSRNWRSREKEKRFRHARRLRKSGVPLADIVAVLDNIYSEAEIIAGIAALEATRGYADPGFKAVSLIRKQMPVPVDVVADRDYRASLRHNNLTAEVCNDPLPGCSMLDRPRDRAPSIVHDPLDDFMFGILTHGDQRP